MPTATTHAELLLRRLLHGRDPASLTHVRSLPRRDGETAPWPAWVPEPLRNALHGRGVTALWSHQVEAANAAHTGEHVVLATSTASGKSVAYLLPVLTRLLTDHRATAIYLAPTKALAADQARVVESLDLPDIAASAFDGDTQHGERDWIRAHARLIYTNPDMLHRSILPGHSHWRRFLRRLSFVVIDECHGYRGVFGSHVAQVVRRLRRVVTLTGGPPPVFILASATVGDPAATASALVGSPVRAITNDTAARGETVFALWQPLPLPASVDSRLDATATQPSALAEASGLLAACVAAGARTLAFVPSRRGTEVVAAEARRQLAVLAPGSPALIAAYRGGYLRDERRALERALIAGEIGGLATTNALELGIDVSGVDAVLLAGYPGTLASLWQQAGRAGRRGGSALCLLIARDDPLDSYLVHHPEALFDHPMEPAVLDPANQHVLAPHLCCAAAESAIRNDDLGLFGGGAARTALETLVRDGLLRARASTWHWTAPGRPEIDLRGNSAAPFAVIEGDTGRLLGTVDAAAAPTQIHPGAVYIHQGTTFVVDDLDMNDGVALLHVEEPDWTTHPRTITDLRVLAVRRHQSAGHVGLFLGDVEVSHQVVGFHRRRRRSREVIDSRPLDLPAQHLRTVAVWWTVSAAILAQAGVSESDIPGALHAVEHASIGLLPLLATCDRWDIGGLSALEHGATGGPTVFVYDIPAGGAGFAERAFLSAIAWLEATRTVIAECGCESGCPSCVHSPKCGTGNDPLNKNASIIVLDIVVRALADTFGGAGRVDGTSPGGRSGHRVDAEDRGRPDLHHHDDVETLHLARDQCGVVGLDDGDGVETRRIHAINHVPSSRDGSKVGTGLGSVAGDDRGPNQRSARRHRQHEQTNAQRPHRGRTTVVTPPD